MTSTFRPGRSVDSLSAALAERGIVLTTRFRNRRPSYTVTFPDGGIMAGYNQLAELREDLRDYFELKES
jgi:hypothetical protein